MGKKYRVDRDNLSTFAKRVKALRTIKAMTQEQTAKALCVHRTSYTKYETDMAIPDVEIMRNMAVFFDVSTDYLMDLTNMSGRDTVEKSGMHENELQILAEFRRLSQKQQLELIAIAVKMRRGQYGQEETAPTEE